MGTARGAARRRGAGGRTAHCTAPWPCPRSVLPAPFEAPTPPPPAAPRRPAASQRSVQSALRLMAAPHARRALGIPVPRGALRSSAVPR